MTDSNMVLVTGASGFIGGRLAERLVETGHAVRVLVRDAGRLSRSLAGRCDVVVGDLGDPAALERAVRGAGVVYHCAANVGTWDTWDSYYKVNVLGVRNLLDAIADGRPQLPRLVHLSTVDVYGFPAQPCSEEAATGGGGFGYGESKLRGESLVREFCDGAGIPYTIIRPANVIGPGSQFIARIGDELKSGLMLKVDGGRSNAGLVYIDNLVDLIIWAAHADVAVGRCYNVRDPYDVSWAQFIERFRTAINGKGIVVSMPFPIADAIARGIEVFYHACLPSREPLLHRLLVRIFGRTCGHSAEMIRADSGHVCKVGFDEAMERSVRWFLDERPSKQG